MQVIDHEGLGGAVGGWILQSRGIDGMVARIVVGLVAAMQRLVPGRQLLLTQSPINQFQIVMGRHVLRIDRQGAFELAGSRYNPGTGGRPARTFDTIADNGGGGAFVFGPPIADWRRIDFDRLAIEARIDGGAPIRVYEGELRRDPVAIAAELVDDLAARGISLRAGDYLSTGSLTLPTPIVAGQRFVARFADLATLELTLSS